MKGGLRYKVLGSIRLKLYVALPHHSMARRRRGSLSTASTNTTDQAAPMATATSTPPELTPEPVQHVPLAPDTNC